MTLEENQTFWQVLSAKDIHGYTGLQTCLVSLVEKPVYHDSKFKYFKYCHPPNGGDGGDLKF